MLLSKSVVASTVIPLVAAELNLEPYQVSEHQMFGEDLAIDSLDAVGLVARVEEQFDISLPFDQEEKLFAAGYTVSDFVDDVLAEAVS